MFVVIVMGRELHEIENVYGPFRSQTKAEDLEDLLGNPFAADYRDPEEYEVSVIPLRKYKD